MPRRYRRGAVSCRAAVTGLILALVGCSSTSSVDRPVWVNDVQHPEYPEALYALAVGTGSGKSEAENQEQADAAARRNLILNLRSRVLAMTQDTTEMRAVISSGGEGTGRVKTEFQDFTQIVGEGVIDGTKIVRRHIDDSTGTVYALAAVNRHVAAQGMAARINTMLRDAETQLAQASPRARALVPLISAYRLYLEARVVRASQRVLVGGGGALPGDRGTEARSKLEKLLRDLKLEVTSGQDQKGDIGAGLPEPIAIRATLADAGRMAPVAGIVLRLDPEHPEAVELSASEVKTDARGKVRFRVPLVSHTGEAGNHIRVAVDLLGLENLQAPFVDVRYALATRDTLRVLVLIGEKNLGETVEPSVAALNISRAIRGAGFPVVDPELVVSGTGKRRLLEASKETLRELVGDQVDVVVRGTATTAASGMLLGLPAVKGSVKLQGVYLQSGRVLVPLEKTAPEAHERREAAGERALRRLARELGPAVVAELEKLLTGKK